MVLISHPESAAQATGRRAGDSPRGPIAPKSRGGFPPSARCRGPIWRFSRRKAAVQPGAADVRVDGTAIPLPGVTWLGMWRIPPEINERQPVADGPISMTD